jgi:hypothetical protein
MPSPARTSYRSHRGSRRNGAVLSGKGDMNMDLVFLGLTLLLFGLTVALVRLCERV